MKTKISILLLFISYGLLAQEPAAIYGGDIIGIKDAPWQVGLNSERWIPSRDISPFGDVKLPQAATWGLYDKRQKGGGEGESQALVHTVRRSGVAAGGGVFC